MANNLSWFTNKWRPSAAWLYLFICTLDFAIFPMMWMQLCSEQWVPITTQGAGIVHLSFGAIVGISAHSRGIEKVALINRGE